jgi:regulator of sigma E protease
MEFVAALWNYILPFLVILTILVFVHELGHYYVARRNGVRVEAFSIGFGPELFGWNDRHGTRWRFALVPLGGFVKMFGETDKAAEEVEAKAPLSAKALRAESFYHKRVGQRAAIVFAGPFVNYVFAIIVLTALFAIGGQSYTPAIVGQVTPDGPAAKAGLKTGDRLLKVNGRSVERFEEVLQAVALRPAESIELVIEREGSPHTLLLASGTRVLKDKRGNEQPVGDIGIAPYVPAAIGRIVPGGAADESGIEVGDVVLRIAGQNVSTFEDIRRAVSANPGRALEFEVRREDRVVPLTVVPRAHVSGAETVGVIGVSPEVGFRKRRDVLSSFVQAVRETYNLTIATFTAISQMISGTRSTKDISGPLRIAELSGDLAQTGAYTFFWFLGVLSLHLCLINLLPVPMLDGGHLLFYGIEAVLGRPLGAKAQEYGFRIGLALVLTLMVFATWNDLVHLKVVDYIKNLFI